MRRSTIRSLDGTVQHGVARASLRGPRVSRQSYEDSTVWGVSFEDRAALVELRPRMATLNPCAMTFGNLIFDNPPDAVRGLAARMKSLGVKPELEIYDTGHLDFCLRMRDEGLLEGPCSSASCWVSKGEWPRLRRTSTS